MDIYNIVTINENDDIRIFEAIIHYIWGIWIPSVYLTI